MPAPKARPAAPDDSRSEASSSKEKPSTLPTPLVQHKGKRTSSTIAQPSRSQKDLPISYTTNNNNQTSAAIEPATSNGTNNSSSSSQEAAGGIAWSALDTRVLHSYRHAYRLDVPAAFSDSYNERILTSPAGIEHLSPTMARRRAKRRVPKEQLALAVRKHFNGSAVQENDVVVGFLYKVKFQDKNFRMRFSPSTGK